MPGRAPLVTRSACRLCWGIGSGLGVGAAVGCTRPAGVGVWACFWGQQAGQPAPLLRVLCRSMASTADIVFMPYNYLIDYKTRAGLNIQWQNAVLIFDEAHNVEVGSAPWRRLC